jgi:tetratricopeptide (TPR) repeat protein
VDSPIRLAVLSLLAFGCASGPAVWREVSTSHFVLRTDLDAETARRAAAELELNRDMLVSAAWSSVEIPEWTRAEVYVLADSTEYHVRFGDGVDSASISGEPQQFFLHGAPEHWEPRWMTKAAPNSQLRYHLAARMAWLIYPTAPAWFQVGVAQFLEPVHLSDDRSSVVLGAINSGALHNYGRDRSRSLADLLSWDREDAQDKEDWRLGGLSWLFVHWLSNTQPEAFSRYRGALMQGTDPKTAFATAFPKFDVKESERALHEYSQHPSHTEVSVPLRSAPAAITERLVSPSDLHVLRARLANAYWVFGPRSLTEAQLKEQIREQIGAALVLDPTNVRALWIDDWSPLPHRLSGARSATVAHPEDERAWVLLGRLLDQSQPGGAEEEAAYRKAIALAPKNPETLNALAWLLIQKGKASEALPFTMRAMKVGSGYPNILDTYAAVMFRLGNCNTAIAAQERALEKLTPARATERPAYQKTLDEYQAACAKRRPRR